MSGEIAVRNVNKTNQMGAMELFGFCEKVQFSDLVPKDMRGKPANMVIAIMQGREIGLPDMQALQSVAVINGRPSLWGDGMLGVVMASGLLESIEETCDATGATCKVKRKGFTSHTSTFTIAEAQKAGLWGKQGPWMQYSSRMLKLRARSFALRDRFPDILKGILSAEESTDIPEDYEMPVAIEVETAIQCMSIEEPSAKQLFNQRYRASGLASKENDAANWNEIHGSKKFSKSNAPTSDDYEIMLANLDAWVMAKLNPHVDIETGEVVDDLDALFDDEVAGGGYQNAHTA